MNSISLEDLQKLSKDRLEDAKALFQAKRYEGALYLCGYAVELGLKKRICTCLSWEKYPPSERNEFKPFKTHQLEILLTLSGYKNEMKKSFSVEWFNVVSKWDVELRYSLNKISEVEMKNFIDSAETLLKNL